jgi:hypothetical protein
VAVQNFQQKTKTNYAIFVANIGNRGSLYIRKYLFPVGSVINSLFPACSYKLKENGGRTTVYINMGTHAFGIALILITIGVGIFSIAQFITGEISLTSFIISIIAVAGGLAILLAGRIKDAPNTLINFMKSTLDINDSD